MANHCRAAFRVRAVSGVSTVGVLMCLCHLRAIPKGPLCLGRRESCQHSLGFASASRAAEGQDLCEFCGTALTSQPLPAQYRGACQKGSSRMEVASGWGQAGPSKVFEVSGSLWVGCSPWDLGCRLPAECLRPRSMSCSPMTWASLPLLPFSAVSQG